MNKNLTINVFCCGKLLLISLVCLIHLETLNMQINIFKYT